MSTFKCPSCGQLYTAPANLAGQLVDCTKCKQSIQVPFENISGQQAPLSKAPAETHGVLCIWLGILFSLFGVIIAAIIGKAYGVKKALIGMVIGAAIFIVVRVGWAIIVVNFVTEGESHEMRRNTTRASLAAIGTAIQAYDVRLNQLPATLDDLTVTTEALTALLDKNRLTDSWGNPYRYKRTGKFEYELRSAGPDGQYDTIDDITNTN